jgi:IclR family transcriptional regulator, mhp operon transcriptional activator
VKADEELDSPSGSLARGLKVLAAVNDLETATVSRVVTETRLPKPTVIRLLQALLSEGYVAQDPETLTYRVTPKVASLSRSLGVDGEIDGLIQAPLDTLALQIKWPVEYLVADGLSMRIRCNNRDRAPIKLKLFERRRFPMLGSAAGLVYLATLEEEPLRRYLDQLTAEGAERRAARRHIDSTRRRGYATRSLTELGPNMAVVSVALPAELGALSLVHFDDVVPPERLRAIIVPRLLVCAREIASALQKYRPRAE